MLSWLSKVNLVIWSRLRLPVELQSFNWPSLPQWSILDANENTMFLVIDHGADHHHQIIVRVKGLDNVARAHVFF